jgi:hypothetical protein
VGHEPEVGRFITIRKAALRQAPQWLLYEMERLRARALPLAARPTL